MKWATSSPPRSRGTALAILGSTGWDAMKRVERCHGLAAALLLLPSAAAAAPPRGDESLVFGLAEGHAAVRWELGEHGRLTASTTLHHPVLRLERSEAAPDDAKPSPEPPPGVGEAVREAAPLPVAFGPLNVIDGELRWIDGDGAQPSLRVHDMAMSIENFSTDRARSGGLPMLITGRGRIGREGRCALFVTVNPWTDDLDFSGRVQIIGLQLEELAGFVQQRTEVRPTSGSLAVFVQFSVHDGRIEGGIRPILTNAEVTAEDSSWLSELEDWVVSAAVELFSRDVGSRERLAATIPLEGPLQDPRAPLWTALWTVIENAFFDAVNAGFGDLRPEAG